MRTRTYKHLVAAIFVASALLIGISACNSRYGASLDRADDPVVLTGADIPGLEGTSPQHIVGFSWDGSTWHQIPIQVDERDLVSPGMIYHLPEAKYPKLFGTNTNYKILVYTPPSITTAGYTSTPTYTPSDSDPAFDANDELSFLAYDTGIVAGDGAGSPAGVDPATRQLVTATDPLVSDRTGIVYLFHSNTLTGGSAGTTGVNYTFNLDSGGYKATYHMSKASLSPNNSWAFNPEHSTVVTPSYSQTFSDRWLNDGLSITRNDANGAELLDRSKAYVTGGTCNRSEDTFDGADAGEGAFVVNISGPVRALRSYMGANSYKYTVATDIFYPNREDSMVELRGHAGLPGYGQADDFATGLTGLTYTDPSNAALPIDGNANAFTPIVATTGSSIPSTWQLVQGAAGSLVTVRTLDTDISGLSESTVHTDNASPATPPCTGDGAYWGQSGIDITSPDGSVPATDPTLTADARTFVTKRIRIFHGPTFTAADAPGVDAQATHPITAVVTN